MDILRPRVTLVLGVAACLFWGMGCASYVPLTSERVDRVPAGHYQVIISGNSSSGQRYNAVLFEAETASVILDAPAIQRRGDATPDDYQGAMLSGFAVYEIRGIAGTVQAYLMVPQHARVRVWDQPGKRGGLMVTVSDYSSVPESGGGGGGGGGM
jgi:hypothetical protein